MRAELGPARLPANLFGVPGLAQRQPGLVQEQRTGRRQGDGPLAALQEADGKLLLECLDLHAQGRLCDMQSFGGTGEMEFFGHGDEIVELSQLNHVAHLRLVVLIGCTSQILCPASILEQIYVAPQQGDVFSPAMPVAKRRSTGTGSPHIRGSPGTAYPTSIGRVDTDRELTRPHSCSPDSIEDFKLGVAGMA